MTDNPMIIHASTPQLLKATAVALVAAATLLVSAVLPAEYGIDPIGIGKALGLTEDVTARMAEITERREASQPVREKTGGSTFKNPPGHSSWKLVDEAGWRGNRFSHGRQQCGSTG